MKRLLTVLTLLLILAACTATEEPPTPPPLAPTATPAPAPVVTPEPLDLTIWLPEWMLSEEPDAARFIETAILGFGNAQGVDVELIAKTAHGPGGLYDFLEKTYPVAPAVLPDLIILPLSDVEMAAEQGYLQPLDDLISPEILDALYPFAYESALSQGVWHSVPFTVDFEYLAFQPSALSDLPLTWSTVLESEVSYAFPAGGADAYLTDAQLLHYNSAIDHDADAVRNEAALLQTLQFYQSLSTGDLVDESALQTSQAEETWPLALHGNAPLVHTTAHLWLRDQDQATTLRFGPAPTADGKPRYLPHGWAYAIVTADPNRQALAAQLIERLLAADALSVWSQAANRLPATKTALALWPEDDFTLFAAEALEAASRRPLLLLDDADFTRAVHHAMLAVLSGETDAATAASTAIENW
jgi:ABC-type glycerol-3-phosphate transport system substrate-binding protein